MSIFLFLLKKNEKKTGKKSKLAKLLPYQQRRVDREYRAPQPLCPEPPVGQRAAVTPVCFVCSWNGKERERGKK